MNFREAEEHLLGLELFGMRFGLDRMHRLTTALGLPQRRFASVHVVGTNGKSSTARFTAAILERHGVRSGSYTSPHLRSFRERIEVGGRPVSEERFAAAVERAAQAAETVERGLDTGDTVTQFELLTAAAYHELAASRVQVAVIEAGLGGRHDATNVIPSRVQVLTGIALEHTRWLGTTPEAIAAEKLAVVRDHATLVVGPDLQPEVRAVAERVAAERGAALITAAAPESEPDRRLPMRAAGEFQRRNFALAAAAARAMLESELDRAAVAAAAANTPVPGRLEAVADDPLTLHDGAHNPAGAQALAAALPEVLEERSPVLLVASVLEDKDAAGVLAPLLEAAGHAVLTRCSNPRAMDPAELASLAAGLGGPASEVVEAPEAAVRRAREIAGPGGAVVVAGSIYLIADLVRDPAQNRASTL